MNLNIFPLRSLNTRVTLFTLTVFVSSIWSLAFYSGRLLREDMERILGEQQFSTVSFMAAEVNQQMKDRLVATETVAGAISPDMMGNTEALQVHLERYPVFQSLFNGGSFVTGLDGTAIASVPLSAERIGVNYIDRDFVISALKDGKAIIGKPVMGKKMKAPILAMAVPIRDPRGKVIGALVGVTKLGLPSFLDKIAENRYGKTGSYQLVAPQQRLIVAATDKRLAMEKVTAPGVSPLTDRFVQGYEGSGILVNPQGAQVLVSAKGVPVAGWYVALAMPAKEAFSPIQAMQQRILLAVTFLTLLAGALTWWMIRRQLSPLLAAARTLATLADTNQTPRPLPVTRQDEIGQLIGSFNRLLQKVEQREGALKETSEALRATLYERDRHQQAVNAHAIVSAADSSGNITYVNDKFCEVSGYSLDELLGHNHRILKSGEHQPEFYDDMWHTISRGDIWSGEVCNRRKDGQHYWVESSIIPFLDASGLPYQYISIRTDITQLKQHEEVLRTSEERLRRGQAYANIGTWDWNIETGELFWSDRVAPLFGHVQGTLDTTYENFVNAIHVDDRQAVLAAINACVQRDVPYQIEHRVVWPDGSVRWLLECGAVTRDASSKARHMLGVVQDIHGRKQAELALLESEKRLQEAQSMARLGHWHADMESGELYWSQEIFHIFGHDPATFKPSVEAFLGAVHPDDLALVRDSEKQAEQTGIHDVVHRIVRPDGAVRYVHELAHAERSADGRLLRLAGTVQDTTEFMEAKENLRQSEERFVFAVEGAGDGIWDWSMQTGAMLLSGHYEAMLGYDKGELTPTIDAWVASVHPDDIARVQQNLQDYLEGKLPVYVVELRLRCKNDGYKWILCRGTVVARDGEGKPERMIGIHSDIGKQKEAHAELEVARESAERANQAKSDFLSSMSHELRTPMNAIIGFAQMLEYDSTLNPDQLENVDEILKGGRHLLELINEVLDLAKIEAGRVDLSLESVDLTDLIEDCRQMIMPLATARRLAFDLDISQGAAVRADRFRLKQALLNLLSNAVKYNREAGSIRLSAHPVDDGRLRIAVADTGAGIPAERIAELFLPFNRLDAQYSEVEGTGIGLTITRQLVELMGGEVGVDSRVGAGTTFWIELPSETLETTDARAEATSASGTPLAGSPTREHLILCIDDNPVNLKLIAQMLGTRRNIHLITAHTPQLGIELALARRPELILLDINMPGMNGYQVLEIFKANESLKAIPVVAVTANALARDIERGRAAGFTEYLIKPLDLGEFLKTIDAHLSCRPMGTNQKT